MGYGVFGLILCKPNWLRPKSMGYDKLWVLTAMGFDRVDCSSIHTLTDVYRKLSDN